MGPPMGGVAGEEYKLGGSKPGGAKTAKPMSEMEK